MKNQVLEEIHSDVWHILLHVHSFQDKSSRIVITSPTRYGLATELVALNAITENIVARVARLADKRKDVRSIKNFCKGQTLSQEAKELLAKFVQEAETVLELRHTRIAHMKVGDLSNYPVDALAPSVVSAVETLVRLVDRLVGQSPRYLLKVGSKERLVDLRASVSEGRRVEV